MQEVVSSLHSDGYPIKEFIPDGKPHRFALNSNDHKNSGFYIGYQNFATTTGESFYVVVYGSWKDGITKTLCTNKGKLNKVDRKNIQDQIAESQKKSEETRLKFQEDVSAASIEKLKKFATEGLHGYLEKKGISACSDMNVHFDSFNENLIIPIRDVHGKVWSLQTIFKDGTKRYSRGGRLDSCFHVLGSLGNETKTIFFAEGFATAATIRMATNATVVVAFDSGNLPKVFKAVTEKYPHAKVVVCCDDDSTKTRADGTPYNGGREAGKKIGEQYCVFPVFKNGEQGGEFSDFNDVHRVYGLLEVSSQLDQFKPKKKEVHALYALGFNEDVYFFTSTSNRQISGLKAMSSDNLLNIMPLEYWETAYPSKGASRVDWDLAKSELKKQCRARGIFSSQDVRGSGVWVDESRVVVNMGDYLIVDGVKKGLGEIKSRFFYTLSRPLKDIHPEPLTIEECEPLLEVCRNLNWEKEVSRIYLPGLIALAPLCGALPIRPHAWITGGAETGKTTVMEKLISRLVGNSIYIQGGSTEAGIRQSLKSDALPIIFDEFETNGNRRDESVQAILELCRSAWSDSHAQILKGSASGVAIQYKVRFSAIVSSIRTRLDNDADKGRFVVLELKPHGGDKERWGIIKENLYKLDEEFGRRLFARMIKMLPFIYANQKIMSAAIQKRGGSRFGEQYGLLFAGWLALHADDGVVTEDIADRLLGEAEFFENDRPVEQNDHDDALEHLMSTVIQYDDGERSKRSSLGEIISNVKKFWPMPDPWEVKALLNLGIKVDSEYLIIRSSNHAEQRSKIWRGTKWENCWGTTLGRIRSAEKNKSVRFEIPVKCVKIPLDSIFA